MEITENKLKEILKEQREEYQTHIGALSDEFQSRLSAGLEPLVTLTKTNEQLVSSVASMKDIVADMAENLEIVKSDIQFIKQELKQKVSVEEFGALEKRVLFLERRFAH